jgi:hypothetical protein
MRSPNKPPPPWAPEHIAIPVDEVVGTATTTPKAAAVKLLSGRTEVELAIPIALVIPVLYAISSATVQALWRRWTQ